jgi:hypothetical protein
MPDPIASLEFCRQEVDRVFGAGHAAANPELVSTIMLTAALDFAAIRLSAAIEQVALMLSEPEMPDNATAGVERTLDAFRINLLTPIWLVCIALGKLTPALFEPLVATCNRLASTLQDGLAFFRTHL